MTTQPAVITPGEGPGVTDGLTYLAEGLGLGARDVERVNSSLSELVASGATYDRLVEAAQEAGLEGDEAADVAGMYHLGPNGRPDLTGWTAPQDGRHARATPKQRLPTGTVHHRVQRKGGKVVGSAPAVKVGSGGVALAAGIAGSRMNREADRAKKRAQRTARRKARSWWRGLRRWLS